MKYEQDPIIIPSKGRAGKSQTIKHLREERADFIILVEPQDLKAYEEAYPEARIKTLPQDNGGLAFARNEAIALAGSLGFEWFWILDDDIQKVAEVIGGKNQYESFTLIFAKAMEVFKATEGLAIGGLEYSQFAWSLKKPFTMNSYVDTCVAYRYSIIRNFKNRGVLKIDRDLALQVLTAGFKTMRVSKYCFVTPKNGSNAGGLQSVYKEGRERAASEEMVRRWPGVCTLNTKPDGRPDVKVNWSLFK